MGDVPELTQFDHLRIVRIQFIGRFMNSHDMITVLMQTLLPEPSLPAISSEACDQVGDEWFTTGILSKEHGQRHALSGATRDQLTKTYLLAFLVGHLDTHRGLACNRGHDANVLCSKTSGEVT